MIKKLDLKTAGLISIALDSFTILIHLLEIFQVMPYTWINGGRSQTYEIARQTSISSIPILVIGFPIILLACGIIKIKLNAFIKVILTGWLWIHIALLCFGLVLQLLETPFEKVCMSIVIVANIIVCVRLAIEKRQLLY